ncbi:MAG: hypothetical protein COW33_05315 [Anaerolineae bacterium CG17_big_fil_post_rev_8_21_14_2_50_57_27]|nr:MAG: hypothetical protein AUK02_02095 [Anaerolineae bacterium CG2_30_58_95]PIW18915.1 MAG: hypothetical protein COW33_05315 [Anaerolineae bacterium CG17_big_fil_post_rev_8_21_14_2_50_57_27]PIX47571.1 MAG: hypothetical protein COZ54_00915 [Anaerolineae bacterium CG_4_8_14_3_um_filter_59_70]
MGAGGHRRPLFAGREKSYDFYAYIIMTFAACVNFYMNTNLTSFANLMLLSPLPALRERQNGAWRISYMPYPYWGWDWYQPTAVPVK